MSNLLISRFYWICIFLCVPCSIKAQQAYQSYADSLYQAGNYAYASLEYERMVFMSNDPVTRVKAVLMKVECLKQLKKYREAQQYTEQHLTIEAGDSLEHVLEYQAALNAYLGGNFKDAYFRLLSLAGKDTSMQHNKNILLLQLLSLNEMRRWKEADSVYQVWAQYIAAGPGSSPYDHIPRLKNPDKAEKLSAYLPFTGAGLFYAGDVKEGVLSALIQIGFAGFGAYCFFNQLYFTAIFAGAGGYASFYQGGIRRAKKVAENNNEKKAAAFNHKIRDLLIQEYSRAQ